MKIKNIFNGVSGLIIIMIIFFLLMWQIIK
jgi:hypothetical protein